MTRQAARPSGDCGDCARCGAAVAAGAGVRYQIYDDEADRPVWRVVHADPAICAAALARWRAERASVAEALLRQDQLRSIGEQIALRGEQVSTPPRGRTVPIGDGPTIDGGGEWFVVSPAHIWYVRGNSADGDDWARSSVGGAIGWRVAYEASLAGQIYALAGVDPAPPAPPLPGPIAQLGELWCSPAEGPVAAPAALWARLGQDVWIGVDADGRPHLATPTPAPYAHPADSPFGGISSLVDGRPAVAYRYEAAPERSAAYEAALPAWVDRRAVGPAVRESAVVWEARRAALEQGRAGEDAEATAARAREALWADCPVVPGRYRLPRHEGWAGTDRAALARAVLHHIPVDAITVEEGVALVYASGGRERAGQPFALWSDGQATTGPCYPPSTAGLAEPARELLAIALQQECWRAGRRWEQLRGVVAIEAAEPLSRRSAVAHGESQHAEITRLTVRYAGGSAGDLYLLAERGGALGEDGEDWESLALFGDQASAQEAWSRGLPGAGAPGRR